MFFVSGNVSLYSRIHNTVQWKRKVRRLNIYKRLKGGYKENSLSSVVLSERRKEKEHKLKHRGVPQNKSKHFYTLGMIKHGHRLPTVPILRDIQKPSGHSPGQPAQWASAWAGVLDQKTSKGPSQPQHILSKYLKLRKMVTYFFVTKTSIWQELEKTKNYIRRCPGLTT